MSDAQKAEVDPSKVIFDLLDDDLKYPRDAVEVGTRGDAQWQPLVSIIDTDSNHPVAYIRADPSSDKSALRVEASKYREFQKRTGIKVPIFLFVVTMEKTQIFKLGNNFGWTAITSNTFPTYQSLVNLADENRHRALKDLPFYQSSIFISMAKWIGSIIGGVIIGGLLWKFGWK